MLGLGNSRFVRRAFEGDTSGSRTSAIEGAKHPQPTSGIAIHSGDSDYASFTIFAVPSLLEAAEFRAFALGAGIRFKSLLGSWQGRQEPSFIVYRDAAEQPEVSRWFERQDAILHLGPAYRDGRRHPSRRGELHWLRSGLREPAGLFVDAPRDWAILQPGWTFDPTRNAFGLLVREASALGQEFIAPEYAPPAGSRTKERSLDELYRAYGLMSGLRAPVVDVEGTRLAEGTRHA